MKKFIPLAIATLIGNAGLMLSAWGGYVLRDLLIENGVAISGKEFFIAMLAILGGGYGIVYRWVMREVRQLDTRPSTNTAPATID